MNQLIRQMLGEDILPPSRSVDPDPVSLDQEEPDIVPDYIRELANAFRTGNKDYVATKVAEEIPTTDTVELMFALGKEESMQLAQILDDMYSEIGDMGTGMFRANDDTKEVISAEDFVDGIDAESTDFTEMEPV